MINILNLRPRATKGQYEDVRRAHGGEDVPAMLGG